MDLKKILLILLILLILIIGAFYFFESQRSEKNLFYDSGVIGTTNTNWVSLTGSGTKTVNEKGATLSCTNSTPYMVFANKENTSSTISDIYDWKSPFCVEFDVVDIKGTIRLQCFNYEKDQGYTVDFNDEGHIKLTYDGTTSTVWINGEKQKPYGVNMDDVRIGFIVEKGESFTYKDFKIYSL